MGGRFTWENQRALPAGGIFPVIPRHQGGGYSKTFQQLTNDLYICVQSCQQAPPRNHQACWPTRFVFHQGEKNARIMCCSTHGWWC